MESMRREISKRGKGACTCSKRGAKEKNVGMPRVEIVSEVNSVGGKYCTLFENEKGFFTF